jgi:uncharacterized protein (TIGR03437 family)
VKLFLRWSTLLTLAGIWVWAQSPPAINGVVNAASGVSRIAPGMLAAVTGRALASSAKDCTANPLPVACNGVTVLVGGLAAPLLSVSPTEIDFQVPYGVTGGSKNVQVSNQTGGGTLQSEVTVGVSPTAPGLYLTSGRGAGVGNFTSVSRPAAPGERVLLFGTGFGPTTPAVPGGVIPPGPAPLADPSLLHISIGGAPATVWWAGIVAAGEYQFNVTIPPLADGDQTIAASVSGVSTQSGLLIAVKN